MEPCTIDGKRCSKCCQAIILVSPIVPEQRGQSQEIDFIIDNWEPITMERAIQVNPYLLTGFPYGTDPKHRTQAYTCKQATENGCAVYNTRPAVCRDYPLYGVTPQELAGRKPDYHPRCTQYPSVIPVLNLE